MKKNVVFETLQKVGRSFMLPIALLPVAGLFLGLGASFTGAAFVEMYHLQAILGEGTILYNILKIFASAGEAVFGNLPIFFAIAVALGMAKAERETAALAGAVAFLLMYASLTQSLHLFSDVEKYRAMPGLIKDVMGYEDTMDMGVFGGVIIGLVVASLHNRFYKVEFHDAFSFFSGTRFVPIISALVAVLIGIVMSFIWPIFATLIASTGTLVAKTGYFGTFIYGFVYRSLMPLGLHHVFYMPFWQTAVGGIQEVNGVMVEGAQNIIAAQLAAGLKTSPEAAKFFGGLFPFMIFGFPAMGLAIYHTAKPEKRALVKGLLISASITSVLTGVTEPIEFTLLFASPILYFFVHNVLAALSFVFMHMAKAGVGLSFSGGLLDLTLYGFLPGQARTNFIPILILGVIYGFLYYFLFRFLIVKMNLKTPGREDDDEAQVKLYTKKDYEAKQGMNESSGNAVVASEQTLDIIEGLGGKENLLDVDNCATRLRVSVKDGSKVNQALLKSTGATGVMQKDTAVQVIYGPKVSNIKTNVVEYLNSQK